MGNYGGLLVQTHAANMSIESALMVLVPEDELLVKPFRDRYDPSAADGVPAHVTLLYPFKPPDEIDQTVIDNLNHASTAVRRLCSLSRWFDDSLMPFCILPQSQKNRSRN